MWRKAVLFIGVSVNDHEEQSWRDLLTDEKQVEYSEYDMRTTNKGREPPWETN